MTNKSAFNTIKIILSFLLIIFSSYSKGQEIKKIPKGHTIKDKFLKPLTINKYQESSVSKNALYLVNKSIVSTDRLKRIPKDSIVSVKIINRDTVIKGFEYDTQIIVNLIGYKKK